MNEPTQISRADVPYEVRSGGDSETRSNGPTGACRDATMPVLYVARLDSEGRSSIGIAPLEFVLRPSNMKVAEVWASATAPPSVGRGRTAVPLDVGVPPGGVRSLVSNMPAGFHSGMHRTETVDFSLVLDGQVIFVVETGEVTLNRGDCVLVCGVLHAWRALRRSALAVTMTGIAMDAGAS